MKLATQLMFEGAVQDAVDHWRDAFPDMIVTPFAESEGRMTHGTVEIGGQVLHLFDSPVSHDFGFTPAMSLLVTCDSAAEVDRLFAHLAAGGSVQMPLDAYDFSPRFGFVTDKFGVSWQIMLPPAG